MLKKVLLGFILISASLITQSQIVNIKIETELGSMVAELYPEKAPITCNNFLRYISNNKLENAFFYRVVRMDNQPNSDIKIEVIQGGLGFDLEESAYPAIKHETTKETGVLHLDGTLSMARAKPGTATSEFFICIGKQPELDYGGKRNPDGQGFAAFGKVIVGMDIVREIQNLPSNGQMLTETVKILSISVIKK